MVDFVAVNFDYTEPVNLVHNNDILDIEARTLDWVQRVVIGLNLCPFAQSAVNADHLNLVTETSSDVASVLGSLAKQFYAVSGASEEATVLFLLPNGFDQFDDYLDLVDLGNALIADLEFEGVLQMATFHPHYQFEDSDIDDAANYTNRSPYPMLHLLQEAAVEQAVEKHPDTDAIPQRNIDLLRTMTASQLSTLVNGEENSND